MPRTGSGWMIPSCNDQIPKDALTRLSTVPRRDQIHWLYMTGLAGGIGLSGREARIDPAKTSAA